MLYNRANYLTLNKPEATNHRTAKQMKQLKFIKTMIGKEGDNKFSNKNQLKVVITQITVETGLPGSKYKGQIKCVLW